MKSRTFVSLDDASAVAAGDRHVVHMTSMNELRERVRRGSQWRSRGDVARVSGDTVFWRRQKRRAQCTLRRDLAPVAGPPFTTR